MKYKFSTFNFQFSILLLLLSGCCKEPFVVPPPIVDPPPISTQRTVLVYLGVDNNFRGEAAEKIDTLKRNWNKNIDGNLLVYADSGTKPVLVHILRTS